jgi:hypothetical protein
VVLSFIDLVGLFAYRYLQHYVSQTVCRDMHVYKYRYLKSCLGVLKCKQVSQTMSSCLKNMQFHGTTYKYFRMYDGVTNSV